MSIIQEIKKCAIESGLDEVVASKIAVALENQKGDGELQDADLLLELAKTDIARLVWCFEYWPDTAEGFSYWHEIAKELDEKAAKNEL